jgi:homoserine dehydrogenase
MREIGIALLGLGNVGLGSFRILQEHQGVIEQRLGARVRVRHVLVRDPSRDRGEASVVPLLTSDPRRVLDDPEVAIVVELIGGTTAARELVKAAIARGKHVVTANKSLLSEHGEELFGAAMAAGVDLHFEGAVCGGIPIIRTIREALASDRIEALYGIVNGTTNFILSAMADEGASYADALARAQQLGYAEADPTLDVSGVDAAQKLSLLASLSFMSRVRPDQVSVEGIAGVEPVDVGVAEEFGYAIKLLAVARRTDSGIEARVGPTLVAARSPLADVRGAFNAVLLQCAALGPALLYGQGAGARPTGSAVVADVLDVCRSVLAGISGRIPLPTGPNLVDLPVLPPSSREGCFYLRLNVVDEPGVLGRIASVLGERKVSIESLVQRPGHGESHGTARILLFTHAALEGDVRSAVEVVDRLGPTVAPTRVFRVENG